LGHRAGAAGDRAGTAHSTIPVDNRTVEIDGQTYSARTNMIYSAVPILTGLPATAIPIGLSQDGLPIGIQAIGPYWRTAPPSASPISSPARSADTSARRLRRG